MMSQDELRQQYEAVNIMAAQFKKMIRLWPILVIVSAIIGGIITITVKAVRYDDNTVKKADLVIISKQITDLNKAFENYKESDIADKAKIKADLQADIAAIDKSVRYKFDNLMRGTQLYTEQKDKAGNIILKRVSNGRWN